MPKAGPQVWPGAPGAGPNGLGGCRGRRSGSVRPGTRLLGASAPWLPGPSRAPTSDSTSPTAQRTDESERCDRVVHPAGQHGPL